MIVLVRYEHVPFRVLILHTWTLFSLLVPLSVLSFMSINSLLLGHLLPCSLPPSLSPWFLLYDPIPHTSSAGALGFPLFFPILQT